MQAIENHLHCLHRQTYAFSDSILLLGFGILVCVFVSESKTTLCVRTVRNAVNARNILLYVLELLLCGDFSSPFLYNHIWMHVNRECIMTTLCACVRVQHNRRKS